MKTIVDQAHEAHGMVLAITKLGYRDWGPLICETLHEADECEFACAIGDLAKAYGHAPTILAMVVWTTATLRERDRIEAAA